MNFNISKKSGFSLVQLVVVADPLTSSGVTYKYWYDSDYDCDSDMHNTILFVKTAELSANQGIWKGNGTSWGMIFGGQVTLDSYGIILK